MEYIFYQLLHTPLERGIQPLLGKALDGDNKMLVIFNSQEQLERIDQSLWNLGKASFVPHGKAGDGNDEQHPIYLSVEENNINNANVLVNLTQDIPSSATKYSKVLDMFNGANDNELTAARTRWKKLADEGGHKLKYFEQTKDSGWQLKAEK